MVTEHDTQQQTLEEGQDPQQTTESDYAGVEAKVGEGLAKIFSKDPTDDPGSEDRPVEAKDDPADDSDSDPADASADDPDPDSDSDDDGDNPDDPDGGEPDNELEDEAGAVADGPDPDAPTLPDAYRRSLKAYGWNDDEIDTNLKTLGDKFLDTAQKIHTNRNAEVQQWANAGRQAREQQQQPGGATDPARQPTDDANLPSSLKPVDSEALKEKYGEDELIAEIVGPVNATIKAINALLPQLEQGVQHSQQNEQQALIREIEGFFTDESLKPYRELYGDSTNGQTLQPEHWDRRNKVLETADALMAGAKLQGRNIDVREALELAHDSVSTEFKETAVRNGIKKEAKKRNRGITNKPSSRGKGGAGETGPVNSRQGLEGRIAQRMKKVFS